MIQKVLNRKDLYKAFRQVVRNKGPAGVDGMKVTGMLAYVESNSDRIATCILNHTYVPKPYSSEERLKKLAEVWRGQANNYRPARIHAKLKAFDEWLRNRLRYCKWSTAAEKKPERKRKNLIRLGVDLDHAYAWSSTGKWGWAVARSPIQKTTITLSRLRRKGYESMLSYYLKTFPSLSFRRAQPTIQ